MPSEPDWSKKIANSTVCTWFWALAIMNAVFSAIAVVFLLMNAKKVPMSNIFMVILSALLGFTNSWFLYLVCSRGLKA